MSIKIDVIYGFLGAGKITIINKLLGEKILGERIAIIENEFWDINIDLGRINKVGIEINPISSRCICCTLAGEFDVVMKSLIDQYNLKYNEDFRDMCAKDPYENVNNFIFLRRMLIYIDINISIKSIY